MVGRSSGWNQIICEKNGEFTVNIVLIHHDTSVVGVVYAPALNTMYWSKKGEGAYKDGQKLPLKTSDERTTFKVVASRSHMSQETQDFIDTSSRDILKHIFVKIECLQKGLEGDVKRLTNFTPEYRLRVGSYRVLFEVDNNQIKIYRIMHRKKIINRKNHYVVFASKYFRKKWG
ncbi:3'(2'),5'-bisphosphate nucleotidase [hydrothermal vent metagenome]|uniref:3'(2'),5'-bisphosphate nucleotidase n=1 Tax=hydrothermal vent metagenome TaxID=652676 RepID=A0A3B1E1K3_9ZZZZ